LAASFLLDSRKLVTDWEIFARPVFASAHFIAATGIPRKTAQRLLTLLSGAGGLRSLHDGPGNRPSVLSFPELVNIAEGRVVL
jgi:hypothetical protein